MFARGYPRLDTVLATKQAGDPGVVIEPSQAAARAASPPPGPSALTVGSDALPRPDSRPDKQAWRDTVARAWGIAWLRVRRLAHVPHRLCLRLGRLRARG